MDFIYKNRTMKPLAIGLSEFGSGLRGREMLRAI
jgi:hypothetical protein